MRKDSIVSRRVAVALIVAGATVMSVTLGLVRMQHGNESTMYWFGLGGLLTVIGAGALQRR
jgi:uncharacterized membrane protein YbjE (DUF340 family)